MIDVEKKVFWKYKDDKIEIDLVKFVKERYATIILNNEKFNIDNYVIEALIDAWNENTIKIEKLKCNHYDTISYYHREGEYAFKVCQSCNEHLD
jgi:hypothetical protein